VWALEDGRHVAGSFERCLIARGERVLRVPTKLMAETRRGARARGNSDIAHRDACVRRLSSFGARPARSARSGEPAGPTSVGWVACRWKLVRRPMRWLLAVYPPRGSIGWDSFCVLGAS